MGIATEEPLSPAGRLFVQPATHQVINCVLGVEQPIDLDAIRTVLSDSLMIKHPRFSSLLVTDDNGREYWRKTELDINRHIVFITDPVGEGLTDDEAVNDYIADLAVSCPLSTDKPLWEIHVLSVHQSVVMRVHHALGDGISLMSLILTLFRKLDDPSQTPTIEPLTSSTGKRRKIGIMENVLKVLKMIWFTLIYVCEFLMRGLWVNDGKTVVSGGEGVEMWPRKLVTAKFSLEDMKTVKSVVTNAIPLSTMFEPLTLREITPSHLIALPVESIPLNKMVNNSKIDYRITKPVNRSRRQNRFLDIKMKTNIITRPVNR